MILKIILGLVCSIALIAGLVHLLPFAQTWMAKRRESPLQGASTNGGDQPRVELFAGESDTIVVPDKVFVSLGIQIGRVRAAIAPEPMRLDGTLFPDANSMIQIQSRFAGELIKIGIIVDKPDESHGREAIAGRSIGHGDRVRRGDLLATILSKEIGEKKSELVDALSKLDADKKLLERLQSVEEGVVAKKLILDAKRNVDADLVAVARAERTLRSWRLSEAEIDVVRQEAEELRKGILDAYDDRTWADFEIRSPIDGIIVEKNFNEGAVVGSEDVLFQVVNLSRLMVVAHVYDNDLPLLEQLPEVQRRWTIVLKAEPKAAPLEGRFDRIGSILDPSQHTALVMGWVDNANGKLRVGQFITARVELPAPKNEVSIPTSALVDVDGVSNVFVQSESDTHRLTLRRVFPAGRQAQTVALRSSPPNSLDVQGTVPPLQPGDRVVINGGIELAAELAALQAAARAAVAAK